MSLRIDKEFLGTRDVNQIKNDCFVEGKENDYGPAETLRAYGETSSALYVPFAYAKTRFGVSPNKETSFTKTNYRFHAEQYPFRTDGGRDQQIVFEQAKKLLRKERSALLSLYCGYGKCLAKDTPVLMYDGTVKLVQNIVAGDLLMGDDSTPRRVQTLARGREEMYRVTPEYGEPYTVNKSHILSLKIVGDWNQQLAMCTNNYNADTIDIPVEEYLKLGEHASILHGYHVAVDFPQQPIGEDPYTLGYRLGIVQKPVPHFYKANSRQVRSQVLAGLLAAGGHKSETLKSDVCFLARSLGLSARWDGSQVIVSTPASLTTKITVTPVGVDDYYGFTIDGNGRFLLGDCTVTHNTYEAIRLAHASRLKCAVLAHRGVLFDQWVDSIGKFTSAKVQQVDTDGILDPKADFYIFNIAFVHKRWEKSTQSWVPKRLGIYKDTIGMLVVDEAHIACASEMSRALLYFNPQMVLALTATPVRKDGMDKVLELYFGKYDTTRIVRIATDPFTVYRLPTGVKPEFTHNAMGKKDWNSVIKYLIEDDSRNKLIIRLIRKFKQYNILVLTKRKAHCKLLAVALTELKITNTIMIGTTKKYDKTARVLLSTYSKLGVGFDDTRLNMLIVACSVTEVEQYAGRLRDGEGKSRVIVDLVDNDPNCLSHWQERRTWYISRNGQVKHYYREFPEEKSGAVEEQATNAGEEPVAKPKRLARRVPLKN